MEKVYQMYRFDVKFCEENKDFGLKVSKNVNEKVYKNIKFLM